MATSDSVEGGGGNARDGSDTPGSGNGRGWQLFAVWGAVIVVVALLATVYARRALDQQEVEQLWPFGSPEDIEELAAREDLNVLFILIDTLRAERMSAYGYERDTTPVLSNLSRFGIRFDRHLAQSSWTKASMASLWTSYYPTRTGVTEYDDIIPDDALLPAEVFSEEGFRTVALYRNGWVSPVFGFSQGFDVYKKPIMSEARRPEATTNPTASLRGTDEEIIKAAREFLRVEGGGPTPWFLYLHLMDVHEYTYDEASAIFGSSYSDTYDSSIRWTDTTLDLFLGTLLDWGLMRDTIVVIASDHGEAFRERGHEGHARFVYRETTETPFIVLLPFRLDNGGIVVRSRSRNVDIFPTLYELMGIAPPPELDDADGVSLVADIFDAARGQTAAEAHRREGFAHLRQGWGQQSRSAQRPTYALTSGHLRYVRQVRGDEIKEELFDAQSDPLERKDVAAERAKELQALRERADALATSEPVWGEPESRELDDLELNQLRALGYQIK